jgi:outer membrane protein assembly factor BamB
LALTLSSCATIKSTINDKLNVKVEADKMSTKTFHASWIKNLDPEYQTGNLPISLGSPLVHEGVVYVGNNRGSLDAYSLKNGRLLWSEKTMGAMHSAPVVYNDLLIYGDIHGRVYGKNLSTGKFNYVFDLGSAVDSTPVVAKDRIFIHTRNHKLFAIDATTGKILWSYKRSVPYFSTLQRTSRPQVISNRIYVGFADGHLLAFSLEEGQVVWEKKMSNADKFVDVDMSPSFFRGKLIVSSINGQAEVIEPQGGILFKRLPFTTNRDATFFDDYALFGTIDGRLIALDDSFNVSKEIKLTDKPISSIKKWKSGLVVTTIGNEVLYLNEDLKLVDRFDLGSVYSAVFGHTSVEDDALAIFSSRNRLYLFK